MESFLASLFSLLSLGLDSSPLILVNHMLRALFFSMTVCHLVALALKTIHFAYAQEIAASRVTKIMGCLLFFYLKIWDYYGTVLYVSSLFSFCMLTLYVYDCCGNIGEAIDNYTTNRRDKTMILSFTGMLGSTLLVLWLIFKNTQEPLHYPYSGIYIFQVLAISVGGLLRHRSIIYSFMGILAMNLLIVLRYYLHLSPGYALQAQIPVEYVFYFLMGLDAEKRQRDRLKTQTYYMSLFKAAANFSAYTLLINPQFQLELFLGAWYIIFMLINK